MGEIEATISQQSSVRDAVVALRDDAAGEPRLVAYVVPHVEALDNRDLRRALRQRLPEYMIPAAFVQLAELPLGPNEKIDRKALPTPEHATSEIAYRPPRTPVEVAMVDIWADVLNAERVGIDDDFFELGGHSLLAMQLPNRINQVLDIDLSMQQLFATPAVEKLALAESAQRVMERAAKRDSY